jgi:hypothetical protein
MFLKVSEVSYNVWLKNINIKAYFPPADDLSLVLRICTNITTTEKSPLPGGEGRRVGDYSQ